MFEITVLGCSSAMPTVDRSLSAIAVRKDGEVFLFDCGEGAQRQMMRFGVSYMKVRAIFISHLHLDHFLGVFGLLETLRLNGRKDALTIYAPPGSKNVFGAKDFLKIVELEDGFSEDFGAFTMSAFQVSHKGDCFGFCLEEKEKLRFFEDKAKSLGIKGALFSR